MTVTIICSDVLEWAASYDGPKFHAILCDPPYEIGFMNKAFDKTGISFRAETWAALAAHLHPGAFGMAFSGARTYHRMACAIEDAGMVLHSMIGWVYGSGFPKATRIDTQIDKAAGAEREWLGDHPNGRKTQGTINICKKDGTGLTAPATPLARVWQGHRYGLQALKPALEPICVFQVPYAGRPVDCITETGAGALNIEQSRVGTEERPMGSGNGTETSKRTRSGGIMHGNGGNVTPPAGRWPSNLVLDEEGAKALGEQSGVTKSSGKRVHKAGAYEGVHAGYQRKNRSCYVNKTNWEGIPDTGSCARFFTQVSWALEQAEPFCYMAKSSRRERDAGLEGMPLCHGAQHLDGGPWEENKTAKNGQQKRTPRHNFHPCCKPIALARHLATLLLPPPEYAPRRLLIPFGGVMSEAIGAALAGWDEIVVIEMDAEYCEIGRARVDWWAAQEQAKLL